MLGIRTLIASVVRAGLGFTIVNKNGLLGFTNIQDAVDFVGARGGGRIHVAPGTYYENVLMDTANVQLIGAGRGCCTIDGEANGYAVKMTASHNHCQGFKLRTTPGGGNATGNCGWMSGTIEHCIFRDCESDQSDVINFFANLAVSRSGFEDCHVTANSADVYAAIDHSGTGESNWICNSTVIGGNLYGFAVGGDFSRIVNCHHDGVGAATYGIILATAADNSLATGCIAENVLSTDIWDQSATGNIAHGNETV